MLAFLTVLIMIIVGYVYVNEGVFTAFLMCINVLVAGLFAFSFWESLAGAVEGVFAGSILQGYEDAICLIFLFCVALGAVRWATNTLANTEIEFPPLLLRGGSVAFGLVTGYLLAGFLVCVLQTLPWDEHFMGFELMVDPNQPGGMVRRVLPADHVWLAMMHRAGLHAFSWGPDAHGQVESFDRNGTFELRYARYRRYTDNREPLPYDGACPP
jgi:hypothetical protein